MAKLNPIKILIFYWAGMSVLNLLYFIFRKSLNLGLSKFPLLRLDREVESRKDADEEAQSLRKDVDSATLTRVELEAKVETLCEELDLLRRATDEVRSLKCLKLKALAIHNR